MFYKACLSAGAYKKGDEETAKKLFEEVLQTDENYIGSYYHLAKLLERNEDTEAAIAVYEKGLKHAKDAGEQHAYNELRSAYEELIF